MSIMNLPQKTGPEIEALVSEFENCTLPAAQFTHSAHLLVALSHLSLSGLTVPEAASRMRVGLRRFLDHQGIEGRKYNETITLFWVKLVRSFMDAAAAARPLEEIAGELLETYSDPKLIYTYYSKEQLLSDEARERWVEPDLRALVF